MTAHSAWPEHKPFVDAALQRLPDPARYDFIVASGGRVSGYYHAHSDLDLYAGLHGAAGDDDEFEVVIDGLPVQVNELPHTLVAQVAAQLGEHRLTRADRGQVEAFTQYGKLASRLVTGVVVRSTTGGDDVLSGLSWAEFRRIGLTVHGLFVARMLEDAAGAVACADPYIGVQGAALALNAALDCLLFGVGDLHWGDALLWRRIAAHPSLAPASRLASDSFQRLYAGLHEPDQAMDSVRAACRAASVLASLAAVRPSQRVGDLGALEETPMDRQACDSDLPFAVAVSFRDGISLLAPRSQVNLTEQEARRELGLVVR